MMKDTAKNGNASFPVLPGVLKTALRDTLPVLMGYLSMGIAFGVLLVTQVKEADFLWALGMSASTISGSMQFAAVEMLKNSESYTLGLIALLALLINIRYAMYGISFIKIFRAYPLYVRAYLAVALTDETYAIECRCPFRGKKRRTYFLLVSAFDHFYWIAGSVTGALLGRNLPFETKGIDFAMTALFLVILTDLCRKKSQILPAAAGGVSTLFVLILFQLFLPSHMNKMLLPAMLLMLSLLLLRRSVSRQDAAEKEGKSS